MHLLLNCHSSCLSLPWILTPSCCRDVQPAHRDLHQGLCTQAPAVPRHRPHSCSQKEGRLGAEVDRQVRAAQHLHQLPDTCTLSPLTFALWCSGSFAERLVAFAAVEGIFFSGR